MKQSCSFLSRFLKPETGDRLCWQGGTWSLRCCPKPGTQKALGTQIQQDRLVSSVLAKEPRDRPQKACERLLMFTDVFTRPVVTGLQFGRGFLALGCGVQEVQLRVQ